MRRPESSAARLLVLGLVLVGGACRTTAPQRSEPFPVSAALSGAVEVTSKRASLGGPDAGLPPVSLGQQIFAAADLVLVGRVEAIRAYGLGQGLLTLRVEERLWGRGPARGETAVVLGFAADFQPGSRDLLFLRTYRDGPRYEIVQRVRGQERDFAAKLEMTRRHAALRAIPGGAARDAAVLDLALEALADERSWTRRYGLAELAWLAAERDELFTPLRLARLEAAAAASSDPEVRAGVESVTIGLRRRAGSLLDSPRQESSSP